MANTILEKLQEKYPYAEGINDARNIAEAVGAIFSTSGRGANAIADVINDYVLITFEPNTGTGVAFSIIAVKQSAGIVFPTCPFTPPEGKQFDYWYINTDGTDKENAKYRPGKTNYVGLGADKTLYAIWKDAE